MSSARERLLGEMVMDGGALFGSTPAAMEARLDAIEQEAIAADRAELAARVRELFVIPFGMVTWDETGGEWIDRAAVLDLLERKDPA